MSSPIYSDILSIVKSNINQYVTSHISWSSTNVPAYITSGVLGSANKSYNTQGINNISTPIAANVAQHIRNNATLCSNVRLVARGLRTNAGTVQYEVSVAALTTAYNRHITMLDTMENNYLLRANEDMNLSRFNSLIGDLRNTLHNMMYGEGILDFTVCHSNCHSNCHGSRSRR